MMICVLHNFEISYFKLNKYLIINLIFKNISDFMEKKISYKLISSLIFWILLKMFSKMRLSNLRIFIKYNLSKKTLNINWIISWSYNYNNYYS